MTNTQNIYSNELRAQILEGMKEVFEAVSSTYGPQGLNVIIEGMMNKVRITKDGATVAQAISIQSDNSAKCLGAKLIQEAASQVADIAGDGTTTCTILTYYITQEANKLVSMGVNPVNVKKAIEQIVDATITYLQSKATNITYENKNEILKVATISANNDLEIGQHIANAVMTVKADGAITVEEGNSLKTTVEITEGIHFSSGHMSPYFITDTRKSITELENVYILVYEQKLTSIKSIIKILEKVAQSGKSLLIIADDLDANVLATLIVNNQRHLKVCAVKAPGYGDRKKDNLIDIAIATGAKLVTEDTGLNIHDVDIEVLGYAKKIIVSKDKTIIIESGGNKLALENRKAEIKALREKTTSEYEKDKLSERLAKLGNGIAVIKVGGNSEIERKELKDRVDDSLHATRAAIEQGVLPGGGAALFYAIDDVLEKIIGSNKSSIEVSVAQSLKKVFLAPIKHILSNAGIEDSYEICSQMKKHKFGYGYNLVTDEFGDMVNKLGIIDPAKVVITALKNAAALACVAITTKVGIINIKEKNSTHIHKEH